MDLGKTKEVTLPFTSTKNYMTKDSLQTLIDQLPDDFSLTSLIEKLKSIEKLEKRELEPVEGRVKNHEEVLDYWNRKFKDGKG